MWTMRWLLTVQHMLQTSLHHIWREALGEGGAGIDERVGGGLCHSLGEIMWIMLLGLQTPLQYCWKGPLGDGAPSIDERIRGRLCNLVSCDGGHAVRLRVVVGRGQHVAGALSRARIQARQRAAYESKPAGRKCHS